MQYKIFCDDYILYDSQLNEFQVGSPVLKQKLNTANELTFTIYPTHPYFNNISKLSSIVRVYRNDNLLFKGRVINSELGFRGEKKITCEGVLAFLLDSVIRPFDFPNDDQFSSLDYEQDNVIEYFLNWIISKHNEQAKDFQKIQLGNVTVTDPNNYLSRSSIEYLSSREVITSRLLKSYRGYLVIRDENGINYLDYLEDFTSDGTKSGNKLVCTQKIEFSKNLLDLTEEIRESYLDMMDEAKEKFEEQLSTYEQISNLIEHDMNLIKMLYGENAYEELVEYYDQLHKNNLEALDMHRQQAEF